MAPRFPQIQFRIPGDNVPENLRAKDNVEFPGYIADTRTLYKRPNTIVVAPLFSGTGQRVKMLEAFAMGCPVVTTSLGAAGYPARGGVEAFIADTVDQFVAALSKLAVSIDLRRTMGERGRRMILDRFGWDQLAGEYLDIVEKAVVSR
jgi:glycosyltransferase involved in cell wall biosynthesis